MNEDKIIADLSVEELTEKYDDLFSEIESKLGNSELLSDFEEVVIELTKREEGE